MAFFSRVFGNINVNFWLLREKGNDILPVGVIYGPNGGGKSNLLAALGCVISLVAEPVYELGKNHARFKAFGLLSIQSA